MCHAVKAPTCHSLLFVYALCGVDRRYMIKLIISDMDGTLVTLESQLPSDFGLTLKKMKEKNILFAVASGRPYKALQDIFSQYDENIIYISENGAYCRYLDEILFQETFDKKQIKQFEKYFTGIDSGIIACCGYKCYYVNNTAVQFSNVLKDFRIDYEIVDDFENIKDEIFQLTVFFENGIDSITNLPVFNEMGHKYEIVKTHSCWIDIYKKHINKGVGIEKVYRRFNISPDETAAFGDFYNDIPMFKNVSNSYCMQSAPDDVKIYARHIVHGKPGDSVTQIIRDIIDIIDK